MHKKRLLELLTLIILALLAAEAPAIGFGPAPQGATLGQALDFAIPLRLEPGEVLAPECVVAEVQAGEQRLQPTQVRARIEAADSATPVVRVSTSSAIDEPVVAVSLSLGCPARLVRRFVLLADPAPTLASAPITVDAPAAPVVAAEPRPAAGPPAEVRPAPAAAVPAPMARPAARPQAQARAARPARSTKAARRADPAVEATVAAAPRSRLRLDAAEPPAAVPSAPSAESIEAAASAAAASAAAAAAAQATSAAAGRIAALEQAIEKMRADAAADRETMRALRARAAEGDSTARWLPLLGLLIAALAALVAWLAFKLRALQRERELGWWNAAAAVGDTEVSPTAAATADAPVATTSAEPVTIGGGFIPTRPGTVAGVFTPEPEMPVLPTTERTQPLPVGWREEPETRRDVTIEELIDLEQQAEFFIVLGQEDAAIDLLVDHVRNTGGGSPLPYLKLLEIYRRRGDREAYDRTRARFNHRFNAYAPDWESDVQGGRSLEDYPSIVARLQMAWPSPIDAMAELESLLFRKSRGELFDMPAYRDVLFLYSLARDLLDREPVDSGNVDVLLPLVDGSEVHTRPLAIDGDESRTASGMVPLDEHPTVPVDLDLTQPAMPESLFGEPTEPGGRRRP